MAPEIFDGNYDEKVDVYALAVILHYMLVGYLPDVSN
jgi:serine/threonine protein kinase